MWRENAAGGVPDAFGQAEVVIKVRGHVAEIKAADHGDRLVRKDQARDSKLKFKMYPVH